jgi:micrococcal nuclease
MKKKLMSDGVRFRGFLFAPCSKVLTGLISLFFISFCLHTGAIPNLCAIPVAQAGEGNLFCRVERAVDGDTLKVNCPKLGIEKVRLIGVDTPETKHPNKPVQFFGKEASAFTKRMAEGKDARLELEPSNAATKHRDRYGRLLAYVFIKQADGTFFDLNAQLIAQGYGHAYTRFPFSRMEEFRRLEREAREAGRGLWGNSGEQIEPQALPSSPGQRYESGGRCLIKGNIGNRGKKIYHLPEMRYYEKTRIDERKGERWFCTEEEARAAGWVKSSQ